MITPEPMANVRVPTWEDLERAARHDVVIATLLDRHRCYTLSREQTLLEMVLALASQRQAMFHQLVQCLEMSAPEPVIVSQRYPNAQSARAVESLRALRDWLVRPKGG